MSDVSLEQTVYEYRLRKGLGFSTFMSPITPSCQRHFSMLQYMHTNNKEQALGNFKQLVW